MTDIVQVIGKNGKMLHPCLRKTAWVLINRKRAIQISEDTIQIIIDKNDLKKIRKAVIERDKKTCIYCGRVIEDDQITIDHLVSKHVCKDGSAGYDSMENLACCCASCNAHKGMKSFEEYVSYRACILAALYSLKTKIDISQVFDMFYEL